MIDLRKKNYSVHYATNKWMEARRQRMMTEKINELDQLLLSASHMTKDEATKFMKKTKNNNEGWITFEKKM